MLNSLKKNYFLLISTFLVLYFFFNLMSGERGLISYFEKKRINIGKTHGTGCTLSSAIATLIPQSPTVFEACRLAKEYVFGAIKAADSLSAGNGAKSLNHFHKF